MRLRVQPLADSRLGRITINFALGHSRRGGLGGRPAVPIPFFWIGDPDPFAGSRAVSPESLFWAGRRHAPRRRARLGPSHARRLWPVCRPAPWNNHRTFRELLALPYSTGPGPWSQRPDWFATSCGRRSGGMVRRSGRPNARLPRTPRPDTGCRIFGGSRPSSCHCSGGDFSRSGCRWRSSRRWRSVGHRRFPGRWSGRESCRCPAVPAGA